MSESATSRQLAKAPVVYVLAQVRFPAILSIEKFVPAIQELIRDRFPRFRHEVLNVLEIGPQGGAFQPEQTARWAFDSRDNTAGFILDRGSLVYHTTAYTRFDDFLESIAAGIEAVRAITGVSFAERVGLRYVDNIVPGLDEPIERYVDPGLCGFSLAKVGLTANVTQQQIRAKTKLGELVLRFSHGLHRAPLPVDLMPVALRLRNELPVDRNSAILDSDHYSSDGIDFDGTTLLEHLRALQQPLSDVFHAATTEYAIEKWT